MIYFIIILIIIFIIIIISNKYKITRYLNYNSNFIGGNNEEYNPSDINYNENIELKIEEERINNYLLNDVNATDGSKIIFNYGASESIANMMIWSKTISRYCMI